MDHKKKAVELLTKVKTDKISLFIEKILTALREGKGPSHIFTLEEVKKLTAIFSSEEDDVDLIISFVVYIFEKAAFLKTSKVMTTLLEPLGIEKQYIEVFDEVWKSGGELYARFLKQKMVCVDNELKNFDWISYVPLNYSFIDREDKVSLSEKNTVEEKYQIKKDIKAPVVDMIFDIESGRERITFTKENMQKFFEELEKIQYKIDDLTK